MSKRPDLIGLLKVVEAPRTERVPKSPIPCMLYESNTTDGREYDCEYEYSGSVDCDNCIVNGGSLDPRTGKEF